MGHFSDTLRISAETSLARRICNRPRFDYVKPIIKPVVQMPPERDRAAIWAEHAISRLAPKRSRIRKGRVQRFRRNPKRATGTLILSAAALAHYPFHVENLRPIKPF